MTSPTRENRFQAGIPARLSYAGRLFPCLAHSLSRSGVLLVGHLPWPEDPDVRLTLFTPTGDVELEAPGTVAHVHRDEEAHELRIGVEFAALDDDQRATLESLINRVTAGLMPAPLEQLPRTANPRRIREALDLIPVAHRINLAARAQIKERRFLREDTNLQVIEGLARNPNTSIQEIKELSRRHNLLPSTVALIAGDRRWFHDEEVKMILVVHPRVTLAIAEELISGMKERSLKLIIRSPGLHPAIKTKLLARFSGRELAGW